MLNQIPVITVDGPSGVGKGTLCQNLAQHFGWHLLDSGAIYRVLAFAALNQHIALDNKEALTDLALALPLEFKLINSSVNVFLDNQNVSADIRTQEVGGVASKIAALNKVREALLQKQRDFRQPPGLIADGRDMGTIVFTDAPVKLFLDASPEARAQRRMNQLQNKGNHVKFDQILCEISERDYRDRNRTVAPLRPAHDALVIDTTLMTISEVFEKTLDYIETKLK